MGYLYKTCIFIFFFISLISANALTIDDASKVITGGDYVEGLKMLDNLEKSDPKISQNQQFQYLKGVCLIETGHLPEGGKLLEAAKAKGNGLANLYLGKKAFLDYQFEEAEDFFNQFVKYREKLKQPAGEIVEELQEQLNIAGNSVMNVEKISIIDTLVLDKDNFFKSFRLPSSSGQLMLPAEMVYDGHFTENMAFLTEKADYFITSLPDSIGNLRLVESELLLDGTWSNPQLISDNLAIGMYQKYPFMLGDGTTLYFASDGPESMGGLDIFIAKRDPVTREYLQPSNLGMPYNSPFDDYMLAIDEENGIGWLASDRNLLGDKLTVYIFQTNDIRKNYDPEDEDIIDYASLRGKALETDEELEKKYRKIINGISPSHSIMDSDNESLIIVNGRKIKSLSDFKSKGAAKAFKEYIDLSEELQRKENNLLNLRKRYSVNKASNVKEEIIKLESALEKERKRVEEKLNEVYRLEAN